MNKNNNIRLCYASGFLALMISVCCGCNELPSTTNNSADYLTRLTADNKLLDQAAKNPARTFGADLSEYEPEVDFAVLAQKMEIGL